MATVVDNMPDFVNERLDDGRYKLVDILGSGGSGVVYLAIDLDPPESVSGASALCAVKIVRKAAEHLQRYQRQEIALHERVEDVPHVLSLRDTFEDEDFFYMILDYCEGDLFRAIWEDRRYVRNDALIRSVFVQLLDAVHACHGRKVFHRDLKPENILCNAAGSEVFVADFGLGTHHSRSTSFGCGSRAYLAPECIGKEFGQAPYSPKRGDIWSLGVILVNLISGGFSPWDKAETADELFGEFMLDDDFLERTIPASRGAIQILKKIFRLDPHARPTIPELRESILALDTFFKPAEEDEEVDTAHGTNIAWADVDAWDEESVKTVEVDIVSVGASELDVSDERPALSGDISDAESEVVSLSDEESSGPITTSSVITTCCPDAGKFTDGLEQVLRHLADTQEPPKHAPALNVMQRLEMLAL